jgi:hypothetical protein
MAGKAGRGSAMTESELKRRRVGSEELEVERLLTDSRRAIPLPRDHATHPIRLVFVDGPMMSKDACGQRGGEMWTLECALKGVITLYRQNPTQTAYALDNIDEDALNILGKRVVLKGLVNEVPLSFSLAPSLAPCLCKGSYAS